MVSRFRSWWQNTSKALNTVIVTSLVAFLRIMVSKLRSWWQQIKQHPMRSTFVSIACVLGIVLLIGGYFFNWTWTGLGPYVSPPHPQGSDFQHGKTLYDWLQLAIIPAALAFGVWWLNRLQQQRDQDLANERAKVEREAAEKRAQAEREAAEKRADTEREIALDNQREVALQAYIDNMSALLLDDKLREPAEIDKVRKIARVRTLTVLPRLDGGRKKSVLQLLYEAGLINKGMSVVDLTGADLKGADLLGAQLSGADLSGVYLSGADLFLADLSGANLYLAVLTAANLGKADLSGANLEKAFLDGGADLSLANLSGANLQETVLKGTNLQGTNATPKQLDTATFFEGVTMPDGTKHA